MEARGLLQWVSLGMFLSLAVGACDSSGAAPAETPSEVSADRKPFIAVYDCKGGTNDVTISLEQSGKAIVIENSEASARFLPKKTGSRGVIHFRADSKDKFTDTGLMGNTCTASAGVLQGVPTVHLTLDGGESQGNYVCRINDGESRGDLCFDPHDCSDGQDCVDGRCEATQCTGADCPPDGDACVDPADCESYENCRNAHCVGKICKTDANCGGFGVCNTDAPKPFCMSP
jgi:hypothetical protein